MAFEPYWNWMYVHDGFRTLFASEKLASYKKVDDSLLVTEAEVRDVNIGLLLYFYLTDKNVIKILTFFAWILQYGCSYDISRILSFELLSVVTFYTTLFAKTHPNCCANACLITLFTFFYNQHDSRCFILQILWDWHEPARIDNRYVW